MAQEVRFSPHLSVIDENYDRFEGNRRNKQQEKESKEELDKRRTQIGKVFLGFSWIAPPNLPLSSLYRVRQSHDLIRVLQ
jgi:hypothetical protein